MPPTDFKWSKNPPTSKRAQSIGTQQQIGERQDIEKPKRREERFVWSGQGNWVQVWQIPIGPRCRLQKVEAQIGDAEPRNPTYPRQRAFIGRSWQRKRGADGEQELPSERIEEPASVIYPVLQVEIGIKIGG